MAVGWYKKALEDESPSYSQNDIVRIAKRLIGEIWRRLRDNFKNDPESRYNSREIRLWIDNERDLNSLAFSYGEDAYNEIMGAVEDELARREEAYVFQRRRKKLEGKDELEHLRQAIKGKSWEAAKRTLLAMSPGGGFSRGVKVEDEGAEENFKRLYNIISRGGYLNLDELGYASEYQDQDGNRFLRRLSEIKDWDVWSAGEPGNHEQQNKYTDTEIYMNLFGRTPVPPPKIQVFRGVSRADAKIRPGDYVTPNRDYARRYMRGKFGAIIVAFLPTDDLIISKIPASFESIELVYYPKSFEASAEENAFNENPPITFRDFYVSVNQA